MKTSSRSLKGFSLLELILVLAVVAILVGLLLPKGFDTLRNARVREVQSTVDTLKAAITDLITMPGGNGSIPRTEGPGIPTSGTALSGASDTAKGNAARLDVPLLATGRLERPLSLRMGTQVYTPAGSGNELTWNQAVGAFSLSPDAVPARNWSAVTRIEARSSNPSLVPSVAQGANFLLDGVTGRPANVVIAYLVIVGAPAKDAFELAQAMNAPQLAPLEGAASDRGRVVYAAPINGVTDVYVYLAEI